MSNALLQEAKALSPWLQEVFFQIHRNPELGKQEYKTQALILAELKKMGIEAEPIADTGVMGIIRGGKPGKTVAFRADMDALPVQEQTDLPYKSQTPNVMHACGHDSHVTMLLGAAKLFSQHKNELCGNVKLFFQPNEEGDGGAERMIAAGCMDNPRVDAVFFGHSTPTLPTGSVTVRSGPVNAASNSFTLTFHGKGSHGASPQNGTDVIVAASQVVTALQTISSRRTSPTDSIVVTIGAFHAGIAGNVLPETATLDGMMRTLNPETRARAKEDFHQIVGGIAKAMGVEVDIDLRDGYAATINNEEMTQLMRGSAAKLLGSENVHTTKNPGMGTEDFAYFCQAAPGCYYSIGVNKPGNSDVYPLHNPRYAVDPDALPYGAALYFQIAQDFLTQA